MLLNPQPYPTMYISKNWVFSNATKVQNEKNNWQLSQDLKCLDFWSQIVSNENH